jgi:hypothetical protein
VLTGLGLLQVVFPLHEELVFLFVIAGFAAGNEIAFGAAAATDDGDNVVHCEFRWFKLAFAVITDACGLFSLPPLAGSKLPSLSPLPRYLFRREHRHEWIG